MKKDTIRFIKNALIFCIVFVILFNIINFAYIKIVLPNTQLARTDNQFENNINVTKILFLGASHTKCSLNPLLINNSFNFASAGENYMQTYYKLKTVLTIKEFRPELIVLPIELNSFSSYYSTRLEDAWYWKKYINFDNISVPAGNISILKIKRDGFFPVFSSGDELIAFLVPRKKTKLIKGHSKFTQNFSLSKNKKNVAIKRAKHHLKNNNVLDKNSIFYFKKILDLAQKKKLEVILIKYPITEEYYNASQEFIPDIGEYYETIFNEIKDYDNIQVFDYQKIFFGKYSLFKNSEHLNAAGAQILSERFNTDLNKIKLKSNLKKTLLAGLEK